MSALPTSTPTKCPTCSSAVPAGASRCPQCGRVFGAVNRCPQCSAIAGVRRSGARYLCVACGAPRELTPGTTVIGGDGPSRIEQLTVRGVDPGSAALARLMRFVGVLMVAAAVVSGAAGLTTSAPLVLMLVIAAALGGGGVVAMRQAARVESGSRERRQRDLERRALAFAESRGGDLTATDAAKGLHLGLEEADALLTSMADGSRVAVEVDGDGIVHYVFRELVAASRTAGRDAPKVRVDATEAETIEAEAAARVERELKNRERI